MIIKPYLRKYFIMGSQDCEDEPTQILTDAIRSGITAFQFWEKGENSLKGDERLTLGKELREICRDYNIPFFVNNRIELVEQLEADGIHVGQEDISVEVIRQRYPTTLIGLSISNEQQLKSSSLHLIDYIGAGPIFPRTVNGNTENLNRIALLTRLKEKCPDIPIVASGGINERNAQAVLQTGVEGVAITRAITRAKNISQVVQSL